jgi:hypothetical protein
MSFLAQLRDDDNAVAHDLPDLVTFLLATGVRIGEARPCFGRNLIKTPTPSRRAESSDRG